MKTRIFTTLAILCFGISVAVHAQTVYDAATQDLYKLYPDMRNSENAFYRAYAAEAARLKQTNPDFFNNPAWPLLIAKSLLPPPQRISYRVAQALDGGALCQILGQGGQRVYIYGINALDDDKGEAVVYPAGTFGGNTVAAGYKKYPAYATSAAIAVTKRNGD